MAHRKDYAVMLPRIMALPKQEVKPPDMPVAKMAQEAVNLSVWAGTDRDVLESAGLDWALVESLPVIAHFPYSRQSQRR